MSENSSPSGITGTAGGSGADDQVPPSAVERAHSMRAALSSLSEAEALLAEASQTRRTAATDAQNMVAEAELLSEQLVSEAQEIVAKSNDEARDRAEGIVSRARAEAAELTAAAEATVEQLHRSADDERARMRSEVRAELQATRERSVTLATEIESEIGSLRPTLEQALLGVTELMGSVAKLRAEADTIELLEHAAVPAESPAPPVQERVEAGAPAGSWAAAQHDDSVHVAEVVEDHEESYAHTADADDQSETSSGDRVPAVAQAREVPAIRESDENGDSGTRPLGWLFRAAQN